MLSYTSIMSKPIIGVDALGAGVLTANMRMTKKCFSDFKRIDSGANKLKCYW